MVVVVLAAVIMEDVIGRHLTSRVVFSSNRMMLVNFIIILFNDTGMKVRERKSERNERRLPILYIYRNEPKQQGLFACDLPLYLLFLVG